jgi:hypothetical protein
MISISGKNRSKINSAGFDGFPTISEIGRITAIGTGYRLIQPLFYQKIEVSRLYLCRKIHILRRKAVPRNTLLT